MPRHVNVYSDMLMEKIEKHNCNVYLINTGMDPNGNRFPLEFTRNCVKSAIDFDAEDISEIILNKLLTLL